MKVTPSGITISFAGTRSGDDDRRPVVARIMGFADGAAQIPVNREMVVPEGKVVEEELDAGIYNVQLTLPSGRILQRNVTINENSNESYEFFEDFVPNAGFSLQESVGRSGQEILTEAALTSGNTSSADYEKALQRAGDTVRLVRDNPAVKGLRPVMHYRNDLPAGASVTPPAHAKLEIWTGLDASEIASGVPGRSKGKSVEPHELSGDCALWRLSFTDPGPPRQNTRQWAKIVLPDGRTELSSLPLPWFCGAANEFAAAELLVDPARSDGAATTLAVHDKSLAGLLAYLDRGQAGAAGPMLVDLENDNVITDTIYNKMSNPLAACAAAYVGLAVYPPGEREQWDAWLGNCMERFPDVPDAAIVHARRLVLRPTTPADNARAADALRHACTAGIPYFSSGVLLLREMLVLLSPDHPDLALLAEQASRIAGRVDASQAFTVLRYATDSGKQI